MRVFVAGATGVLGRPLVDRLVAAGHAVTGMTRRPERAEALRDRGAAAAVADALDATAVGRVVAEARPEVVLNALTDIPAGFDPRRYEELMAGNDRLRREAGPALARAAEAAGARRLVAESIAFVYAPAPGLATEADPLWHDAPGGYARTVDAVDAMERAVIGADLDGLVLRFGWFHGPGTSYAPDGPMLARLRERRLPVVGGGRGVMSFTHVEDAADAMALAVERPVTGILNVVEDNPPAMRDWLPLMAERLGGKPPRRVPAWVARPRSGPEALAMARFQRGASNARARAELGWEPRRPFL